MSGYEAAGRRFRTESEYKAAKRDLKLIEEIKSNVHMEQPGEVISLCDALAEGKYRFESVIGNDFDDEIYELAEKYKSQGYTKSSRLPEGKRARKKAQKKQGKSSEAKRSAGKKNGSIKSKSQVSLDDYDGAMKKAILEEMKKREKRRKLVVVLCGIIAVGCFGYFGVYSYFADRTQMNYEELASLKGNNALAGMTAAQPVTIHYTEEDDVELKVLPEYETLYNKNKKLIGWLKIDDTIIDYPVMQTSNNEYYLDHNFNQEKDNNGSIFMDTDCVAYPRSQNLILYGHHMKSGKMFGDLEKYASESYYKKHSIIHFDTIYEKSVYQIMYVFRTKVLKENEIAFKYYQFIDAGSGEEFNSYMNEMAQMSLYDTGVTAQYGDELLTLSTCDHSQTDGRFVVVAKRIQ